MKDFDFKNLLYFGSAQFLLFMVLSEILYPGYNTSKNYISDLGVGDYSFIFNLSIIVFGICVVISAFYFYKEFKERILPVLLGIAGLGAAGVGVFPETLGLIHIFCAGIAFLFGGLSCIYSSKISKGFLGGFSIVLGFISLASLMLMISGNDLGLGVGGIERMIAYPIIIWGLIFGGHIKK